MGDWGFLEISLNKAKEIADEQLRTGEFDPERLTRETLSLSIFDDINAYQKSEKNLRECEPFEELYQKYLRRYEQYKDSFEDLYKGIEDRVHRREYASGGVGTHRGYYSPSMSDLIVIGANRGKLLKRKPNTGKLVYEYLFDKEDNMICVRWGEYNDGVSNPSEIELFFRENDIVFSFVYDINRGFYPKLCIMSECHYRDGIRIKHEYAGSWSIFSEKDIKTRRACNTIMVEDYEYDEDGVFQTLYRALYYPSIYSITIDKHCFYRDEEGDLSSYIREQTAGYLPPTNDDRKPQWFCQMKKKRKGITPFE